MKQAGTRLLALLLALPIVQKGDGSVVVSFEYTTYTFFPAGLIPAEYEGYMVPNAINLMDVSVTTYGTRTDWYHK